jgi:hypothetical protein
MGPSAAEIISDQLPDPMIEQELSPEEQAQLELEMLFGEYQANQGEVAQATLSAEERREVDDRIVTKIVSIVQENPDMLGYVAAFVCDPSHMHGADLQETLAKEGVEFEKPHALDRHAGHAEKDDDDDSLLGANRRRKRSGGGSGQRNGAAMVWLTTAHPQKPQPKGFIASLIALGSKARSN